MFFSAGDTSEFFRVAEILTFSCFSPPELHLCFLKRRRFQRYCKYLRRKNGLSQRSRRRFSHFLNILRQNCRNALISRRRYCHFRIFLRQNCRLPSLSGRDFDVFTYFSAIAKNIQLAAEKPATRKRTISTLYTFFAWLQNACRKARP